MEIAAVIRPWLLAEVVLRISDVAIALGNGRTLFFQMRPSAIDPCTKMTGKSVPCPTYSSGVPLTCTCPVCGMAAQPASSRLANRGKEHSFQKLRMSHCVLLVR